MSIDADDWFELHEMLRAAVGEPLAQRVMSFLPPTGWPDLATKDDLAREIAALRSDVEHGFAALRSDVQREIMAATATQIRWVASLVFPTMIASVGISTAVTAALVA